MVETLVIAFRETLETSLIVGIILAFLFRSKQERYTSAVYWGVGLAVVASVITALLFNKFAGGFEGPAEQIFEGTTMLFAAVLLTYMIFWMMFQRGIKQKLESKVAQKLDRGEFLGIMGLTFFEVFKEGVETVIFLQAIAFGARSWDIVFGIVGIIAAVLVGYLLFATSINVNLKRFFAVTSVFLILFAAGLAAHAIHEYQEAGLVTLGTHELWNLNPPQNPDGSYPLLHEDGHVGHILKGLFGYRGNPTLLEVIGYVAYFVIIGSVLFWLKKREWVPVSAPQ